MRARTRVRGPLRGSQDTCACVPSCSQPASPRRRTRLHLTTHDTGHQPCAYIHATNWPASVVQLPNIHEAPRTAWTCTHSWPSRPVICGGSPPATRGPLLWIRPVLTSPPCCTHAHTHTHSIAAPSRTPGLYAWAAWRLPELTCNALHLHHCYSASGARGT